MGEINIKRLKNPNGRTFLDELENAENLLSKENARSFFKAVLSNFEYEISPKIGNSILKSIQNVVENSKIANIFVSNDFILLLPFSQKIYANSILDIFRQLFNNDPNFFTSEIADAFSPLIPSSPEKSLTLIAYFAKNSAKIDDPIPVFNLAMKHAELFVNDDDLVFPYLTLLAYLCDNSKTFRKNRLSKCSKILSLVMDTDETFIIKSCYNALKTYRYLAPSMSDIKRHLKTKSLQSSVISYLILSPPLEIDEKLLDMFLTIASNDERGTLILLQIAQNEENAELILQNPEWMRLSLPTPQDTLKLLLVIFHHVNLRNQAAENQYFLKLLIAVVKKTQETEVITVVCTILRRIKFTKSIVQDLKAMKFLTTFFNIALSNGENIAVHSGLLLTDTFAKISYFPDFIPIIESVCEIAKEGGPLKNVAAQLTVDLAIYDKCMKEICKYGMESFFKKNMKDQKLRKYSQKFIQLLNNEYDDYYD